MNPSAGLFNLQINVADLVAILGAGLVIYGRLVSLETKIDPIWKWWNATRQHEAADPLLIDRRGHMK